MTLTQLSQTKLQRKANSVLSSVVIAFPGQISRNEMKSYDPTSFNQNKESNPRNRIAPTYQTKWMPTVSKTGRIAASLKSREKNGREKERKKIQIENGGELLSPPTEVT